MKANLLTVTLVAVAVAVVVTQISAGAQENASDVAAGAAKARRCDVFSVPDLKGGIEDSCCDIETAEIVNREHFFPILDELVKRTYFRYFKADLWKQCTLWLEDGMCADEACAVCESDPNEIPNAWKEPECSQPTLSRVRLNEEDTAGKYFKPWKLSHTPVDDDDATWIEQDETSTMAYVNLLTNPEGYTGYAGDHAHRIWNAIRDENCFTNVEGMCLEERVFTRILSGVQASISSHLATRFKFKDGTWGPNVQLYVERVGRHPEWLRNMFFVYMFVTRAVVKASPMLQSMTYHTGNAADDARTIELINQLTNITETTVLRGFDESVMFKVRPEDLLDQCPHTVSSTQQLQQLFEVKANEKASLMRELRSKFRNISRIMDCVGCEKCRLWGKLQFLGIGTAMKVLFTEPSIPITLSQNEAVALINVFRQLSKSVRDVRLMRELEGQVRTKDAITTTFQVFSALVGIALVIKLIKRSFAK